MPQDDGLVRYDEDAPDDMVYPEGRLPAAISLQPGELVWAPADEAWRRMRALHDLAIGATGGPYESVLAGARFDADAAFRAHSNLTAATLARLAVSPPGGVAAVLDSLTAFGREAGGLDGIEGPFLSAAIGLRDAAQYTGRLDEAAALLGSVGLPGVRDGGARLATVLDGPNRRLGFADADMLRGALGGLAGGGAAGFGGLQDLYGSPARFGDPGLAGSFESDGRKIGVVVGAICGAIAGAAAGAAGGPAGLLAGGTGGAKLGIDAGEWLGEKIGGLIDMVVGWFKDDKPSGDHGGDGIPTEREAGPPVGEGEPGGGEQGGGEQGGGEQGGGEQGGGEQGGGEQGGGEKDCPDPDGDTGFSDGSVVGGRRTRTAMPFGPGLAGLVGSSDGNSLSLTTLPAYDGDTGGLSLGYLADLPGFAEAVRDGGRVVVSPAEDGGTGVVDRERIDALGAAVREAVTKETPTTIPDRVDTVATPREIDEAAVEDLPRYLGGP